MKLFDTHAHFDPFAADGTLAAVLARAAAAGVERMCAVGSSAASNELTVRLAREHPDALVASVGYDRDQLDAPRDLDRLAELAAQPGVVAVGEIGLDYYYSAETAPAQRALFGQMLAFAAERRRPVIVHSRYADDDTIDMLGEFSTAWKKSFHSVEKSAENFPQHGKNGAEFSTPWKNVFHSMENEPPGHRPGLLENPSPEASVARGADPGIDLRDLAPRENRPGHRPGLQLNASLSVARGADPGIPPPGVLHCFTGDAAFAEKLLALGFMISFAGIVSFNNAGPLRDVARHVPEDRLLIETDCPYLTPKPFRGKVNEPAYVARVAEVLAEARGADAEELAAATFANAVRMYQLGGRT